jgi:hypothetical protein
MRIYSISIFLILFASCHSAPAVESKFSARETKQKVEIDSVEISESEIENSDATAEPEIIPKIKLKDDYNDIALFLSGKKLNKKSPYFELTKDSSFIKYSKSITYNYKKYNDKQLVKISDWSKKELAEIHQTSKDIFYPFSGPDIIHALTVFPNGENYYLFGLEPVGEIPDLQNIPLNLMNKLFFALNKSMSDNLNLSFFITKKMYKDLNSEYIKGTIPVLLFFLSKMNYHIQEIKPVAILDDGSLEIKDRITKNNFKNYTTGVEISFVDTATNQLKKIYYFSMDISNAGFKKHLGMQNFMHSFKAPVTTLVKSASYCLHGAKYSLIRDIIADKTKYLLQDDTGIPYSYFSDKNWTVTLFGSYDEPVKIFTDMYQKDLKKAMDEKAKPIDFRFGYTEKANILLGIKKLN